ncbi:hypothetical protein IW146_000716 [Coemansia sp. RSA 922]|nr:hypothetical protein H4S03_000261 [Coemansia sp. S3946]KAJ2054128.1 hypothetical protein H4S04_000219 [Coemansia sp. S16]KAJ2117474.1 hypothetical protein IW146_000716 [Coemansia sp. RSA 922]
MSTLSPLQLFPLHVVRLIVNHVAGSSRMVYDGVRVNSHEYRTLLKPLLWVCHNFRTVAYSRYCNNFGLNLSSLTLEDLDTHYLQIRRTDVDYRKLNYLGYSTHHFTKDITVFVDERTVYSGKALEAISRSPYDGCSFPLARRLIFILVKDIKGVMDEGVRIDPLLVEANIGAFVQRVKQMAPLVGEIRVQPGYRDNSSSIPSQYFDHLASRLYQLANRVDYGNISYLADTLRLQLDMICHLTYLGCSSGSSIGNVSQFIQLARKNALTLQSLILGCRQNINVLGLVQDAEGNHVAYPRLKYLNLWSMTDTDEPNRPQFHSAGPFPILQRLRINLYCSFDDDTFFRGNAATLESLHMQLDSLRISMLRKYKVFVPGSHPSLQVVKLSYTDEFLSTPFSLPADVMEFVYNIGSGAVVREYSGFRHDDDQVSRPLSLGSQTCIRVLSLPSWRPQLWDAIVMVKSLPLLSDLQTSVPSLGPMPDGVTPDTLPEHVISNYAPMGRRFRCWHLNISYANICSELATCVLLLALACPNFDYAAPPISQREMFMKRMEKGIGSDCFKPYAPRLCRLLFHGWDERKKD